MTVSNHNPAITPEDVRIVEGLLSGLSACDLERLAAPLRPGAAVGEAGHATLVLLNLIDAELERRQR